MRHPIYKHRNQAHPKHLGISRVKAQALSSQQIKLLNRALSLGFISLVMIALIHALLN